jgi:hypothetical protein
MVDVGLHLIGESANLTFIFFIASALLVMIGARFAYYAFRNRAKTEIETQAPIWTHLLYIGALAALYGVAGLLQIGTSLELPYRSAIMLGTTLLLAFAIRQIHYTATTADGRSPRAHPFERVARAAFVALVFLDVVVLALYDQSATSAALEGISAIAFVAYGFAFFHDQTSSTRLQGTMLDSLLRHLLPILAFASLVNIVSLAVPFGLQRVVVLHIQVVFIIMTATALMTGTIKLRQNLASL